MESQRITSATELKEIEETGKAAALFRSNITVQSIIACCDINSESPDISRTETEIYNALTALKAEGGLQEMLVAQMLSAHSLQQKFCAMARGSIAMEHTHYFANTAVKLANLFIQQAELLTKLQGGTQQKITVERVDIHEGGQAIVGNVNVNQATEKEKK